jgi:uncharacterized protein (DUF302 family)
MKAWLGLAVLLAFAHPAWGAEGMIEVKSAYGAKQTMDRLEVVLRDQGVTIFLRVDHAAGAAKIGKKLRATELLIFGNPQGGTPLMECSQTAGIDLPLKALAREDESGQVWLGYNDPAFIAARHGAAQCPAVANLKKALASFVQQAVAK